MKTNLLLPFLVAAGFFLSPCLGFSQARVVPSLDSPPAQQAVSPSPGSRPSKNDSMEDPMDTQAMVSSREKLTGVTLGQIKLLLNLINRTQDEDPEKADLLWRLANASLDVADQNEYLARSLDEAIFQSKQKNDKRKQSQLTVKQKEFEKKRNTWQNQAKTALKKTADHPAYLYFSKMDRVLFLLASLLMKEDQAHPEKENQSKKRYMAIVENHVHSDLAAPSYFYLAEISYEQQKPEDAIVFYEKSLRANSESTLAGYAFYKKGWCHFQLQQFSQAKASFAEAISWSKRQIVSLSSSKRLATMLMKSGLDGFVQSYARIDLFLPALAVFQSLAPEEVPQMLRKLANNYETSARYDQAILAYTYLIQTNPQSNECCDWQWAIVKNDLAAQGGRAVDSTLGHIQSWIGMYEEVSKKQAKLDDASSVCHNKIAPIIKEVAQSWQTESRATHSLDAAKKAWALYKAYLQLFPNAADLESMQFWGAELLFQMGSMATDSDYYCQSAPLYSQLAEKEQPSSIQTTSAFVATVAWQQCLFFHENHPEAKERLQIIQATTQSFIHACTFYLQRLPNDPNRPDVLHAASRLYLKQNRPEQAIPLLYEITSVYASHSVFPSAVEWLIDAWQQDVRIDTDESYLEELIKKTNELKEKTRSSQNTTLALEIGKFQYKCLRKQAEIWSSQKKYKQAAERYLWLAVGFEKAPAVAELWYNAAVCFRKAGQIHRALATAEAFLERNPSHERVGTFLHQSGVWLYEINRYPEAAQRLVAALSHLPKQSPEAENALLTAAFIHRMRGEKDMYLSLTAHWIKRFGEKEASAEKTLSIFLERLDVLEGQQNENALQKEAAQSLLASDRIPNPLYRALIEMKWGASLWRQSCPVYETQGLCISSRPAQQTCTSKTKPLIVPHTRNPEWVKQAKAHFEAALGIFTSQQKTELSSMPKAALDKMQATIHFLYANEGFEHLLALSFPSYLESVSSRSNKADVIEKKMRGWINEIEIRRKEAVALYEKVILMRDGTFSVASLHRIAALHQSIIDAMASAPLPKTPPTPKGMRGSVWAEAFENQYCDQLSKELLPLEEKTAQFLELCQQKGADLHIGNEWTHQCSDSLSEKKPVDFPLQNEIPLDIATIALPLCLDQQPQQNNPADPDLLLPAAAAQYQKALSSKQPADVSSAIQAAELASGLMPPSPTAYSLLIQSHILKNETPSMLPLIFAQAPVQSSASLLFLMGQHQARQGNETEAYAYFNKALAYNTDAVEIRLAMGFLCLQMHNTTAAAFHFQKILQQDQNDAWALLGMGITLRIQNKWAEAEEAYRKARTHAETACASEYNLAVLLSSFKTSGEEKETKQAAKQHYEAFLQCAPPSRPERKKAQEWVDLLGSL